VQNENGKKAKKKVSSGCPMLKKQALRKQFRNEAMNNGALDIEDLVYLGNKIGTCPYYGARDMVQSADLVILPYQSLLLRSARESLGLHLKGNIVIIDEAHNLADSLTSMHNSKITFSQVETLIHILFVILNCLIETQKFYMTVLLYYEFQLETIQAGVILN
jgi:chromosome transmission fidelity protein 1